MSYKFLSRASAFVMSFLERQDYATLTFCIKYWRGSFYLTISILPALRHFEETVFDSVLFVM